MRPAILCVHQIGKVGSTTVVRALQRMMPQEKIYQTHDLDQIQLLRSLEAWLQHPEAPRCKLPDHLSNSIELRRHFFPGGTSADWKLITLVREPLGRNVSAFFQNLHRKEIFRLDGDSRAICQRVLKKPHPSDPPVTAEEMLGLVRELLVLFRAQNVSANFDEWFDREMRDLYGIDVFARPFAKERGYAIYEGPAARLLLFRLEDLKRVFHPALEEFFAGSACAASLDPAILLEEERSNDGSTKAYADVYRLFLRELRVSEADLEAVYGSRVSRHFYTENELGEFRSRWKTEADDAGDLSAPARL